MDEFAESDPEAFQPPEDDFEEGDHSDADDAVDALDEELAATQAALDEERAKVDEETADIGDFFVDEHAAEAEELGFRLAWWEDTSLFAANRTMGKLFGQLLDSHDTCLALRGVGLSEDTMVVDWKLDQETGPLVMTALQLLGIFIPELRDAIKKTLGSIPIPKATEAEEAAMQEAYEELSKIRADAWVKDLSDIPSEPDFEPEFDEPSDPVDGGIDFDGAVFDPGQN